jgi:predicted anti-sigma-YlaC factor YlaD
MNCKQIRELLPDLAAGTDAATLLPGLEVEKHLAICDACTAEFRDMQKTMALLDEWQVPEPSTYFDTRMQARLREEMARPTPARLFQWLRRPVWAMALAAIVLAGAIGIGVGNKSYFTATEAMATKPPALGLPVQPGTAVGDLQALEKNDELYADFDVLDELQVQDDVTANP